MLRLLLLTLSLFVWNCSTATPTPPPLAPPTTPAPPPPTAPAAEQATGTVRVTASSLNVRREPSGDADVVTQAKRGTELAVLLAGESWTKVRLEDGTTGWVASRFVARDGERKPAGRSKSAARSRTGCPPDSDYAFVDTPVLRGSDRQASGLVVVEATVNTKGKVTATKVISNTTGDESLAFMAEREIQSATFSPPIRNCVPRSFIFTYRRTF